MVNHYRYDFIGLSSESKPTPTTSEKVADGSTFYESNTSKLYVWYKDQWYEKEGGGSYELPTASSDTLGGVKVGDNLAINSETGVLSGNYSAFTGTDGTDAGTAGLVPAPTASDSDKYLKSDGTWATFSGGGPTVVQTPGDSTTDVMSQNATTSMVFDDPATKEKIKVGVSAYVASGATNGIAIGKRIFANGGTNGQSIIIGYGTSSLQAEAAGDHSVAIGFSNNKQLMSGTESVSIGSAWTNNYSVAIGGKTEAQSNYSASIGYDSKASANYSVALGYYARTTALGAIAIGAYSSASNNGEFNIGSSSPAYGYNSSLYRRLSGVYDPLYAHDAATKGYVDNAIINGGTTAPTTSTAGIVGTLYAYVDTSGTPTGHLCICTSVSGSTYNWSTLI